ncbi:MULTISPECIES: thiamine pyrophosphate-dependent enzyme [unclassified Caballeronia]|uniref:alpha-ketoacid dehydrogenase subunit alpha/beta n=1 Tax=unclassified Caballeronia TaxID=2646786 RepID=UPI0028645881|nr:MULTISPECIES: thiamine pyrophosphate-dependent enzyme [unclassified Caballeronia]MDR5777151.1 thiamine pyrophosphate-dependent enzyme [Caballeronia sp. LZ002]MDR5852624.1 thiamine pyrophosphate-dependent enzyme [Caballeronia sp. LZ003]
MNAETRDQRSGRAEGISATVLKQIYREMVRISAVDVGIRHGLAAGKFQFNYWPVTGQEAIPACLAPLIGKDDHLVTTYRGWHDHVAKGVPLREAFAEAFGRVDGINRGKGGPPHLVDPDCGAMLTTAIVGAGAPVANGLALAAKARGTGRVTVVNFGDGATSIGAVHEAVNMAGALRLPVLFMLQNNQIGEYTPVAEYTATNQFVDRASGYGIKGIRADGNDIVAMYRAAQEAVRYLREGNGPVLFEAVTLRLGPHYGVTPPDHLDREALERGQREAPIPRARKLLIEQEIATEAELAEMEAAAKAEVDDAIAWALQRPQTPVSELECDVYDRPEYVPRPGSYPVFAQHEGAFTGPSTQLSVGGAVRDAMDVAMAASKDVILLGEDVGKPGGLQKTSVGLYDKYGGDRVISTPIAETAIIGAGIGAALAGMRPICEIMFSDFLGVCLDQVANHAAKQRFMSAGKTSVPMTMRVMVGPNPMGGTGAQHTQSLEAWLLHVPGLKVVYPSTPREAKGLLTTCIWDEDPCAIFENLKLLHTQKGEVPQGDYRIPLGVADIKRPGKDISVLTYGWQVHEALAAASELAGEGIDVEVVDLRSLLPLDYPTVFESVRKTRRALVLTAATRFGGFSGEVASTINEELHRELHLPAQRMGALFVPIGYARHLEAAQMPRAAGIAARIREIVKG